MQTLSFTEIFPKALLVDFLRYALTTGIIYLVFWVLFFKKWQHRVIQKKPLQLAKMYTEFAFSLSTVFVFALIGTGIALAKSAGHTLIYDDFEERGWVWFFASIGLMIVLHDAYFYWTHRLMHHPLVFRHVHLVHHRSTNPSPWAAYAFHPLEAVVEAGIFPLLVFTIPLHGLALFVFLVYMIVRNVLGHLGIEFLPKNFLSNPLISWHTSTTHHDLHHKDFNHNYGLYFTWWDKWCKTEHPNYAETFEEVTTREKAQGHGIKTLLMLLLASQTVSAQSVAGLWQTYHDKSGQPLSMIHIQEKENSIEGRVEKIFLQAWEGEDPICEKCPGDLQGKKVIGLQFLWGFKKTGNTWNDGHILDPVSGETYQSKLWLEQPKVLKVKGYWGVFYRTQTWHLEQDNQDNNPVTGIWKTIDDKSGQAKSLVKISEQNGVLFGQIIKIYLQAWEGEDPICISCPDQKKDKKVVGMTIAWGFTKKDKQWEDGKILDPGNGKTYLCSIWLENENTLKIRGYWGPFFRTQTWKRIKSE